MSQFSQRIVAANSLRQTGTLPISEAVKPVLGEKTLLDAKKPGVIPPRVVILTALADEFLAVEKYVPERKEIEHEDGTIYECGQFVSGEAIWDVAIVETGQGNRRASTETQRAIAHFKPNVVLFVGIAGGRKETEIGDVVVGEKIYNYESGRAEIDFKTRPEAERPSYRLEQRARAITREWRRRKQDSNNAEDLPTAYVGAIAAGESVVASTESEIAQRLTQSYGDALAVEKEGYGFLATAREIQKVSALVIRGISDRLDNKEATDKQGSQPLAARHAAQFAFELLAKLEGGSVQQQNSTEKLEAGPIAIDLNQKPPSAIAILHFQQLEDTYRLRAHHSSIDTLEEQATTITVPIPLGKFGRSHPWNLETVGNLEGYIPQKSPQSCMIGQMIKWVQYLQQQDSEFSCLLIEESHDSIIPWELLNLGERPLGIQLQTVRSRSRSEEDGSSVNLVDPAPICPCEGGMMVYGPMTAKSTIVTQFQSVRSYAHEVYCHEEPEQIFVHLQQIQQQVGLVMMMDIALQQVARGRQRALLKRTRILKQATSVVMLHLAVNHEEIAIQREMASMLVDYGARGVLGMVERVDRAIAHQIINDFFAEYHRNRDLPIPEILRRLREAIAQQLDDNPTDELAHLYLATFMYAYYGHPMTVLQLTPAEGTSYG